MISALEHLFSLEPFVLLMLGTSLGITIGAIPGLTGAMLIALSLPLTFAMAYTDALILLVSMYVGSISGGLVTATLLRIPGTPASIMTTLDGYPLARAGQPGRALGLGIGASFTGGMISWIFLVLLSGPMADLAVGLGPFEFFSLVLMALALIASVAGKSLLMGVVSGFLGILASMPGTSPVTGKPRLTFGLVDLDAGLNLLPVLIGLFAVSRILREIVRMDVPADTVRVSGRGTRLKLRDWRQQATNLTRSSLIGTWVGILPGVGANIGSVLAYSCARSFSRNPERFGKGSEEGIVASEAANNATVGGALIPLVAMGIPGSVIDAILLGALVIHGLQPGPLLLQQNPDAVHTIFATVLVANCFMLLFMLLTGRILARLTAVPRAFLVPIVLVFCVVGSYALSSRMFDVWVMLFFGVVGFAMESLKIPLAPFVIGFVLAPVAEENLCAGLMASGGSYWPLVARPVSLLFFSVAVVTLLWPLVRRWRRRESAGIQTTED